MMKKNPTFLYFFVALTAIFSTVSCSGGGGGGGGPAGRTRDTALRVVHGALDGTPVIVRIGEQLVQQARYNQKTEFAKVDAGETIVTIERQNAPGSIVSQLSTNLEGETEYTLLIFGQAAIGSLGVSVLAEPVVQPEPGFARVQLLNTYQGATSVRAASSATVVGTARYGGATGFVETTFGPQTFDIISSDGVTLGSVVADIPDQGELTILVSGSEELGVQLTQTFDDLD